MLYCLLGRPRRTGQALAKRLKSTFETRYTQPWRAVVVCTPAKLGLDNREWRTPNLSGKFARLQPQGRQVSVTLQSCAMD
jgi:hypothetical protein